MHAQVIQFRRDHEVSIIKMSRKYCGNTAKGSGKTSWGKASFK